MGGQNVDILEEAKPKKRQIHVLILGDLGGGKSAVGRLLELALAQVGITPTIIRGRDDDPAAVAAWTEKDAVERLESSSTEIVIAERSVRPLDVVPSDALVNLGMFKVENINECEHAKRYWMEIDSLDGPRGDKDAMDTITVCRDLDETDFNEGDTVRLYLEVVTPAAKEKPCDTDVKGPQAT